MSDDDLSLPQTTARADYEILLRAFGECLQQGRFDSAREILASARAQAEDDKRREQVEGLGALLDERQTQREAGVQAAVTAIEEALAAGQRMRADRLLFQAVEEFGEHPELARIRGPLETAHRRDFESDVRRLIEEADRTSEEKRDSEAQELVIKARALISTENEALMELLAVVEARIAARTERHRQLRIEEARQQITERLVDLDYPGARAILQALVGSLGAGGDLRALQDHLVSTHQSVLEGRVREAGVSFEHGRFGEACVHLRSALVLSPENPWIQKQLTQAETRLAQQEEARESDPAWRAQLDSIESQRAAGELEAAERSLELAEQQWGVGGVLDEERERLRLARLERFTHLLRGARTARSEGRTDEARKKVELALELMPGNAEAIHLAEVIDRTGHEEALPEAPPELVTVVAEIQERRAKGPALLAWKCVQEAIDTHGDREPLSTLRRLIADEMLAGDGT